MEKKQYLTTVIIVVCAILLFPIPLKLKDGGSVQFKALTYSITKYHILNMKDDETYDVSFKNGWGIKVLGYEILNTTK